MLNLHFLFPVGTEYNSDLSCHYKVELSYENLVTSGPDPHPPPIADDESDDEDDDDVPRVSETSASALCVQKNCVYFYLYYFMIYFDLGLTLGGPLRPAGQGLGDQSVSYHS